MPTNILPSKGALNVMIPSTFFAGILTFVWPFVKGTGAYAVIAVLYGCVVYLVILISYVLIVVHHRLTSGAFVGLLAAPMIALGDVQDVGRRLGMYFSLLSLGALAGPPISGAINTATDGYSAVGIYAGESFETVSNARTLMRRMIRLNGPSSCFYNGYRTPSDAWAMAR